MKTQTQPVKNPPRLNTVTIKDKDGVGHDEIGQGHNPPYLAELFVVVKEGRDPHYFNGAGFTLETAVLRLRSVLMDAVRLMRALGTPTDMVDNLQEIALKSDDWSKS